MAGRNTTPRIKAAKAAPLLDDDFDELPPKVPVKAQDEIDPEYEAFVKQNSEAAAEVLEQLHPTPPTPLPADPTAVLKPIEVTHGPAPSFPVEDEDVSPEVMQMKRTAITGAAPNTGQVITPISKEAAGAIGLPSQATASNVNSVSLAGNWLEAKQVLVQTPTGRVPMTPQAAKNLMDMEPKNTQIVAILK